MKKEIGYKCISHWMFGYYYCEKGDYDKAIEQYLQGFALPFDKDFKKDVAKILREAFQRIKNKVDASLSDDGSLCKRDGVKPYIKDKITFLNKEATAEDLSGVEKSEHKKRFL